MIINHNMASLNTYRQMSTNMTNTSKSLEKLSSGLRINKAGDDAAGLAISEKMRGQIRGLDQAARNGQDGISMLNTAEGALSETHSILQRMKELATQSANDTNTSSDRDEIQKEINQLTSEVNRIGNTTEFNTQKLLNGGGVDPTSAATGGAKLNVPAKLLGGLAGGPTQASSAFTLSAIPADATTKDGMTMELQIGDRNLTIKYDSTADHSNVSGDTITLKTANSETAITLGTDLGNQLTSLVNADDKLRGNYTVAVNSASGAITVSSVGASYSNTTGQLTGNIANGNVKLTDNASTLTSALVNTAAVGASASNVIDFSNLTKEDLVGSGIIANGKSIDFFDSSKGAYEGDADYSVDLNGARTPEKIVDAIVTTMKGSTAVTDTGVWFSKTDTNKLQVTAATSGIAGNDITLYNNAVDKVATVYNNDRLTGEGVVSAKGLADGEQKVTLTKVAATVGNETTDGTVTAIAATIDQDSTLESGTYRLTNQGTLNHAQMEKLDADGTTWNVVSGYEDITITGASQTAGDLTFTGTAGDFTAAAGGTDWTQFSITGNHIEATLTEAGSASAGTAVTVSNGQTNVKLSAADDVGEATVNVGTFDASDLDVGDSITFSFDTKQGAATDEIVGGKFKATFQIGANTAQSMTIEVNDMRSQALKISGTEAGGSVTAANGSVATLKATSEVTNGTDNTSTEFALDVSTHEKATAAISVLDDAIQRVSAERSKIGAYTNRLDHTITNLGTSSENLTAAESRVRDVDMAKEMMAFQKNNILSQAAQAMMAQANQQPQGVLQLLR